jgi:hypothetical protein
MRHLALFVVNRAAIPWVMDTQITPTDPLALAEWLLSEAGFTFTEVEACPHPACEICVAHEVDAAA